MINKPECTHILNQRGALVVVVVKLLLPPQVLLLGRLKTHGDHLRTGQHLAAFDCDLYLSSKGKTAPACVSVCFNFLAGSGCPCHGGCGGDDDGDDDVAPVIQSGWRWTQPAALCLLPASSPARRRQQEEKK